MAKVKKAAKAATQVSRIVAPQEGATIDFVLNSKSFLSALSKVKGIMGNGAKFVINVQADKTFEVIGFDSNSCVVIKVEAGGVIGEGCFEFDSDLMKGIFSNRAELAFHFGGSSLKFKATKGRYTGDFAITPVSSDALEQLNYMLETKESDHQLSDEIFKALKAGMSKCDISDVYTGNELMRYIRMKDKRLTISSYDEYHAVQYATDINVDCEDFSIAVTPSYFNNLSKLSADSPSAVKLTVTENTFYAQNDEFFLSLPPIQSSETEFTQVLGMLEQIMTTKPDGQCQVSGEKLQGAVDNLCAVYESGASIAFDLQPEKISLKIATNYGKIGDSLRVNNGKGKANFTVDPLTLGDILKSTPDSTFEFRVKEGSFYLLRDLNDKYELSYTGSILQ